LVASLKTAGKTDQDKREALREQVVKVMIAMQHEGIVFGEKKGNDVIGIFSSCLKDPYIALISGAGKKDQTFGKLACVLCSLGLEVKYYPIEEKPLPKKWLAPGKK
jgi:hypothetical protein